VLLAACGSGTSSEPASTSTSVTTSTGAPETALSLYFMRADTLGVANRTLPCGTLVKFAYRGRTLTVPVVDRGPYAKGVEWDLTAGAAQELGLQETVKVGTRVVGQTANTPTLGVPAGAPALTAPATPAAPVAGGTAAA